MSSPLLAKLADPTLLRSNAYIAGQWVDSEEKIAVADPASGAVIGDVPDLSTAAADAAVTAAQRAFASWSTRTGKARGVVLRAWSDLILANVDDLATILTAEQGKPFAEAKGEVAYAAAFLEWFAEEARRVDGDLLTPHAADRRLVVSRQPIGIVGAITPWNFPLAMITRKAGPALAVGCTMVLKPSELTPLSALALARLAERAGVPAGVFNVVTGDASAIGTVFTSDPRVRKFTFTGSTAIGKMLAAHCMTTVKRVSLELGGNAPFVVFDDADLDEAIEGLILAKFRNTGQTCVCANRVLVHQDIHDAFAARLADRVGKLKVGAGLDGVTDQGPLIDERALAKVEAHVRDAIDLGGTLLVGGKRHHGPGHFYAPTVVAAVPPNALLCREETFGPLAALIKFADEAEAIAMANDSSAGLAAYLYTRDGSRQWRVGEALAYGMVGINTGAISTEVAPFGGIKESGFGREGSRYGIDDYLDIKLMCIAV